MLKRKACRDQVKILWDILTAIKDGVKVPTKIMQRSNASPPYFLGYLNHLMSNKLITEEWITHGRRLISITERGKIIQSNLKHLFMELEYE